MTCLEKLKKEGRGRERERERDKGRSKRKIEEGEGKSERKKREINLNLSVHKHHYILECANCHLPTFTYTSDLAQLTLTGWAATAAAVGSDVDVTDSDSGITESAVVPLGSIITVDWAATFKKRKERAFSEHMTEIAIARQLTCHLGLPGRFSRRPLGLLARNNFNFLSHPT